MANSRPWLCLANQGPFILLVGNKVTIKREDKWPSLINTHTPVSAVF